MEDQIEKLIKRYGNNHDYRILTEKQKAFLLDGAILNNKDGCGLKTVEISSINAEADGALLDLLDIHTYVFHDNGPGSKDRYAIARIPEFKRALGITEDPAKLEGPETYLFQLTDNSKVKVQYLIEKDRV